MLKERFGLRISQEDRNAALGNADEALAKWSLELPPSLQIQSSSMTIWTASLHLTYNNFLIILHRPHPKASIREDDHGANDSDICSSAANAIATIFEDLRMQDQLKYLWISDINSLFTTMVQISVELRFSNPILAINALRRFDSSLLSLRKLVEYWTNADWILRIFEESSHVQHGIRLGKPAISAEQPRSSSADGEVEHQLSTSHGDTIGYFIPDDQGRYYETGFTEDSPQVNYDEWGQAIPQPNFDSSDFLMSNDNISGVVPTESEWREIYWQVCALRARSTLCDCCLRCYSPRQTFHSPPETGLRPLNDSK